MGGRHFSRLSRKPALSDSRRVASYDVRVPRSADASRPTPNSQIGPAQSSKKPSLLQKSLTPARITAIVKVDWGTFEKRPPNATHLEAAPKPFSALFWS